jgi:signal transduction histidine kinase
MKKILLICFLLYNITLLADITNPFSLELIEQYEGGKLLYNKHHRVALTSQKFYFVKKSWIHNNETIYKWKGTHRNESVAESFSNISILDGICFQNKLRLIVQENNEVYITSFSEKLSTEKYILSSNFISQSVCWVDSHKDKRLFLLNENTLLEVQFNGDKINVIPIAKNVLSCKVFDNRDDYILSYIMDRNDICLLYIVDNNRKKEYIARFPITDNTDILYTQNYLVITNSISDNSNLYVSLADIRNKSLISAEWLDANKNIFCADTRSNNLYAITSKKSNFVLNKISYNHLSDSTKWQSVELPQYLYKPLKLVKVDDKMFVFFSHSLMIFDEELNELLFDNFDYSLFTNINPVINIFDEYFIISSNNNAFVFYFSKNNLWWFNKYVKLTYRFAIPLLFLLLSVILYRKYRNQKRLFDAIIDLPLLGFLFIVNRAGKLIKVNDVGKQLLGLSNNIQLKKQFAYYCNLEHSHQINNLIEFGLRNKELFQQKINIIENNIPTEWLCSLIPLNNITGMFKGVILIGIDITKALEKQMLTNWAQLAHDMQTNLSTIRLNIENLNLITEEDKNRETKILHQVSILVHRIRDIVTVGRDDKLELINTNSIEFCNEIRNEFDDNIFSNIKFKMELNDFNFCCDRPKLLRAMRNAVENSIKYMKNKSGTITIACNKDIHNITLSVKDTGVGMDETTKNKIFTPFYSTERQAGGHGIGTMIMQRVVEQHGGKLLIESKIGVGTEIIFLLPDLSNKSEKMFKNKTRKSF